MRKFVSFRYYKYFCFSPLGVTSYYGYTLARWNNGEKDKTLKVATFTSDTKPLTLPCQVCHYCAFYYIGDFTSRLNKFFIREKMLD